jgi:hypothetical protein
MTSAIVGNAVVVVLVSGSPANGVLVLQLWPEEIAIRTKFLCRLTSKLAFKITLSGPRVAAIAL